MKPIETVGMVGFGAMGQLMAKKMFTGCEVVAHDPRVTEKQVGNVAMVDLKTAASQDAVVLAVPAGALHDVVRDIAKGPGRPLPDDTLVVDICSVKTHPEQIFGKFLRSHWETLLCHPLFGPESAGAGSLRGHRVIVTGSAGDRANELTSRWEGEGLNILHMSADEHDQEMVGVLAVPFILGRLVSQLGLTDSLGLQTPSRLAVRKLEWLDDAQSQELFETATQFNPHVFPVLTEMAFGMARMAGLQTMMVGSADSAHYRRTG